MNLKPLFILGTFLSTAFMVTPGNSNENSLQIMIGKDKGVSNKELVERVYFLERAVRELQDHIQFLETAMKESEKTTYSTCFLQTPFNGTFQATRPTEISAKAVVLEKCGEKTGPDSVWCKEDKVQCGK